MMTVCEICGRPYKSDSPADVCPRCNNRYSKNDDEANANDFIKRCCSVCRFYKKKFIVGEIISYYSVGCSKFGACAKTKTCMYFEGR